MKETNTAALLKIHDQGRMPQTRWERFVTFLFWSSAGRRWVLWDIYVGAIAAWSAFNLTPYGRQPYGLITGVFFGLIMGLSSWISGIPRPESNASRYQMLAVSLLAVILGVILCMFMSMGVAYIRIGRWIWLIFGILSYVGITAPRLIAKTTEIDVRTRVIVYGFGNAGRTLAGEFSRLGSIEVVAFCDDDPSCWNRCINGIPCVGGVDQLEFACKRLSVKLVCLAITGNLRNDKADKLLALSHIGVGVMDIPRMYEAFLYRVPIAYITPAWLFSSQQFSRNSMLMIVKRITDIVCSILGLAVTLPFWPLIALAVRLDSKGPVFFTQWRMGHGNKPFRIIKFRTMAAGTEETEASWTKASDPRVTRLGRFLRRTRIDEIPQLLNVLKGEMSIVGPRPERPEFVSEIEKSIPFYGHRYLVPPGITGWAQVRYRYGASLEDTKRKLEYDLYYIRNMSFRLDLQIMLQTVVLLMKGSQ